MKWKSFSLRKWIAKAKLDFGIHRHGIHTEKGNKTNISGSASVLNEKRIFHPLFLLPSTKGAFNSASVSWILKVHWKEFRRRGLRGMFKELSELLSGFSLGQRFVALKVDRKSFEMKSSWMSESFSIQCPRGNWSWMGRSLPQESSQKAIRETKSGKGESTSGEK